MYRSSRRFVPAEPKSIRATVEDPAPSRATTVPELAVLTDLAAMARAVRVADALALSLAEDRKVSLESAGPVPEEVLLGGPDE